MIEDVVIGDSWLDSELDNLFADLGKKVDIKTIHFSHAPNMETLAVEVGAYKSKGEARRANRVGPIPTGWTILWINKTRKLYIWNPLSPTHSLEDSIMPL